MDPLLHPGTRAAHRGYRYPVSEVDLLVLEDAARKHSELLDATAVPLRMRRTRRTGLRSSGAALALLCICLAPLAAPCGEPEPAFDEQVHHHLVRAGYLGPLDVLRPFDATGNSDQCRLARNPSNCPCEGNPDRIARSSGT